MSFIWNWFFLAKLKKIQGNNEINVCIYREIICQHRHRFRQRFKSCYKFWQQNHQIPAKNDGQQLATLSKASVLFEPLVLFIERYNKKSVPLPRYNKIWSILSKCIRVKIFFFKHSIIYSYKIHGTINSFINLNKSVQFESNRKIHKMGLNFDCFDETIIIGPRRSKQINHIHWIWPIIGFHKYF